VKIPDKCEELEVRKENYFLFAVATVSLNNHSASHLPKLLINVSIFC